MKEPHQVTPGIVDATLFESTSDLLAHQPLIVYDGECVVCTNYVSAYRAVEALGAVHLANARELNPTFRTALMKAYDLNSGMLFVHGGEIHHGDKAVNVLALVSSRSGLFNRINAALFRSPAMARIAYPFLVAGRSLLLRLQGKRKISTDTAG